MRRLAVAGSLVVLFACSDDGSAEVTVDDVQGAAVDLEGGAPG